eukprot:1984512-Rhodomonas_salina.1
MDDDSRKISEAAPATLPPLKGLAWTKSIGLTTSWTKMKLLVLASPCTHPALCIADRDAKTSGM